MDISIDYNDYCYISRNNGEVDASGEEIRTPVWEGKAQLQVSHATSNKFDGYSYEHEPIMFIPVNDIHLMTNDHVEVTTINGRVIVYTIQNYEPIKHSDYKELNNTCIWLKDGKEKVE